MKYVMKSRWVMLAVLCALPLMMTKGAQAQNNAFWLVNDTEWPLNWVWIYPDNSKDPGPDQLAQIGAPPLETGDKVSLEPATKKGVTRWTIMIRYQDGTEFLFPGFKLSELSEITVSYNDGEGKAVADNGQEIEDND